jgi:hypothetical protein
MLSDKHRDMLIALCEYRLAELAQSSVWRNGAFDDAAEALKEAALLRHIAAKLESHRPKPSGGANATPPLDYPRGNPPAA